MRRSYDLLVAEKETSRSAGTNCSRWTEAVNSLISTLYLYCRSSISGVSAVRVRICSWANQSQLPNDGQNPFCQRVLLNRWIAE